jgi:hypothetical protein
MPLPQAPFTRSFVIALGGPVYRLERHLDQNVAALHGAIRRFLPRNAKS